MSKLSYGALLGLAGSELQENGGVSQGAKVMDTTSVSENEEEGSRRISTLLDFAEIFIFLQSLGQYMKFPRINLTGLEDFFRKSNVNVLFRVF